MRATYSLVFPSFIHSTKIPFHFWKLNWNTLMTEKNKVLSHDFFLISCFHHMKLHLHQIFTFLISLMLCVFYTECIEILLNIPFALYGDIHEELTNVNKLKWKSLSHQRDWDKLRIKNFKEKNIRGFGSWKAF